MSNELYSIIVSGERLILTKDQILSDPGNYFETYFFGGFAEGSQQTRELHVHKDVQLLKLIQAHLRGYEIIPLADTAVPWYMTKEGALINLLHEAQFYCLQDLVDKIQKFQNQLIAKNQAENELPRLYQAKALWNYTASADDPNELSFRKDEVLDILENSGKWWQAKKADGTTGTSITAIYNKVSSVRQLVEFMTSLVSLSVAGQGQALATLEPYRNGKSQVVSGEPLHFTRDQMEPDPRNHFETYFFGEFAEGSRGVRELIVEKNVQLFKLIRAHL